MTSDYMNLLDLVRAILDKESVITEPKIIDIIEKYSDVFTVNEFEKQQLIKKIHAENKIKMDVGSVVTNNEHHDSWYFDFKPICQSSYWESYRHYLRKNEQYPKNVIAKIDASTDKILDLLGDPRLVGDFARKGLVIGDVQSGKTSTYISIVNKAADAGYKVIVILTGTIEKLRSQTQSRVDQGFVGTDSAKIVKEKKVSILGVGKYDVESSLPRPWSFTTTLSDFNNKIATQLIGSLSGLNTPLVFVLKKNKSVLENLVSWLQTSNSEYDFSKSPLLLIDDECDNASVDTSKVEDSPTTINRCIRDLLATFNKSSYVAFTATPFANIFINPEKDEDLNTTENLFPKDFIYYLDSPSNYIGADAIFGDEALYSFMICNNNDCEGFLPAKHKKEFVPERLPKTLINAIHSFLISNVIRDLRGESKKHRSMLVNVTRFKSVQGKVTDLINNYLYECVNDFKNYSTSGNYGLKNEIISLTKTIYEKFYLNNTNIPVGLKKDMFEWNQIQENLYKSNCNVRVQTVNSDNSGISLDYTNSSNENGTRIIAVGGFSLSRGLTLEGLSISYFYRNSKMYDTLLQMGRWFGYRDDYNDLCQIWMSDDSYEWYSYITSCQEDLKEEIRKMMIAKQTPIEFGLGVRQSKAGLIVTALNKMRYTKEINRSISLSGSTVETECLTLNEMDNYNNLKVTCEWLDELLKNGYEFATKKIVNGKEERLALKHLQILNVEKSYLIEYLKKMKFIPYNKNFEIDAIIGILNDDREHNFDNFDILIASSKNSEEVNFLNYKFRPVQRSFSIKDNGGYALMSKQKSRLGAVEMVKGGLTPSEVNTIEENIKESRLLDDKEKKFKENDYFSSGFKRNPLLIIYPVFLKLEEQSIELMPELNERYNLYIGLSMGFPNTDGKKRVVHRYKVNLVKWKQINGIDDDFEGEE